MVDDPLETNLLYLTNPEPKVCVLNVQTMAGDFIRFAVSRSQLFALNRSTADILVENYRDV